MRFILNALMKFDDTFYSNYSVVHLERFAIQKQLFILCTEWRELFHRAMKLHNNGN